MASPHLIALVGFESFENTTFESFFRLATRREPGYAVCADVAQSALVIVNGDNAAQLAASMQARRAGQPVLVIARAAPALAPGVAFLARPIRFMAVLGQVEAMLGAAPHAVAKAQPVDFAATRPMTAADRAAAMRPASVPDFQATQPFMPMGRDLPAPHTGFAATQPFAPLEMGAHEHATGFEATQPFAPLQAGASVAPIVIPQPMRRDEPITLDSLSAYKRAPEAAAVPAAAPVAAGTRQSAAPSVLPLQPQPRRSSDFNSTGGFLGLGTASFSVAPSAQADDVLVVDDSDVALKFMQTRLGRLGFRVTSVRSGEEALAELPRRHYRYIFLDVMMTNGMDGFQTCRAIQKMPPAMGTKPLVFLLSNRGGVIDKMRGKLAGADAYLTKPLNDADLNKVLAKHEAASGAAFAASRAAHSREPRAGTSSRA